MRIFFQENAWYAQLFKLVLNYYHMQKTFFFFLTKAMNLAITQNKPTTLRTRGFGRQGALCKV